MIMQHLSHETVPGVKINISIQSETSTLSVKEVMLSFHGAILFLVRFFRNSQACHMTMAVWLGLG